MFYINHLFLTFLLIIPYIHAQDSLEVKPVYTTEDTCLDNSKAFGPITSNLNNQINGGQFTMYGIGGRGACGLDIDTPTKSAAASGNLFNNSAQWVPSCLPDKRYILNDPICINKCVKITYKCVGCSTSRTLTVPINNKCPECAIDHVDLSNEAFIWLEPQGGTVGIAKDARITYIDC
uniref:Expansin n=1 Tax=Meloidogyne incognita TaxID=6306 RepID=A0A914LXU9_MELIC